MRRSSRWLVAASVLVAGCGLFDQGGPTLFGAPPEKPKNVFLPADDLGAGQATDRILAQEDRERMAFTASEANVSVAWDVDGVPTTHRLRTEQVALRVADVPTMLFSIGHMKMDATSLLVEPEASWSVALGKHFFRDGSGAPIQIFFDIQTVGDLVGRLDGAGDRATGHIIGSVQIDGRRSIVNFDAEFFRPTVDTLKIRTTEPIVLPIKAFHRDERLKKAMDAVGASGWSPDVFLSVDVTLSKTPLEALPTFIRVPITEVTMSDLHERIDADVDDYDAMQYRLRQQGMRKEVRESISRDQFDMIQETIRKHKRNPDGR